MTEYAAPRGMRDFYPEDFRSREAIFEAWKGAARQHGFEFYDSCPVETMELLERKAGEEISEQIYTFLDKSNRRLALRPELTPTLARMIIAHQRELALPLKWTAIVQCFRYERMTRGRKREHFQWNLDIVGEEGVAAEVEVVAAAVNALRRLGLTGADFQARIGSRTVLGGLLAASGIDEAHFPACFLALDKRGKIGDADIAALLSEAGVPQGAIDQIFEIMSITTLDQVAARVGEEGRGVADLRQFFELAVPMGIADCVTFDVSIVRGLGYYTGIVFEAFDTQRKLRAIFGGGRYDNLLSSLGGDRMPCVGLGFGDVVVAELLAECGKSPRTAPEVDYAVGYMEPQARDFALRLVAGIRRAGGSCDAALAAEKAKAFFRRASRAGARQAIYVGPQEVETGRLRVKDMQAGQEKEVDAAELMVAE